MDYQLNKLAYVTGCSRGIGAALVDLLLDKGYHVVGLSRTSVAERNNFTFIPIDLNDLESVRNFQFTASAEQVLLINNAGMIGEVTPVGQLSDLSIEKVINVNTIAPQILMNKFLKTYSKSTEYGHIINISSGAGKHPIDAWASYCASKAALDLFSRCAAEELQTRGVNNWYIHAIAPGVVDTEMQTEIRSANPSDFMLRKRFVDLKKNNELSDPNLVAQQIFTVIDHPVKFPDTVISVRDF